jgi:hypothetical protein
VSAVRILRVLQKYGVTIETAEILFVGVLLGAVCSEVAYRWRS